MKAHFIGICGKGMSGVAVMLKQKGWTISGSDEGSYEPVFSYLNRAGIPFAPSYALENIPSDADLIVVGKHARLVPEENEEVRAAFASGKKIVSFPEVLAELSQNSDNIIITGSFGKSTCTALLSWCLVHAGKDPSYFIGAVPFDLKENAHLGTGTEFVIEGDEYPASNWTTDAKFLFYTPHTVLLTSGEHDHLNVFPTEESYLIPYQKLVAKMTPNDILMACKTGKNIEKIISGAQARVVTYGLDTTADWHAKNIYYGHTTRFDLYHGDEKITALTTTQLGTHSIENIVGVAGLVLEKKLLTIEELASGIAVFSGISGRLDRKHAHSNVNIYEVFGSSQTKLSASLTALKLHFPERRIIAVFEPHTFSWRNRSALPWYAGIFDGTEAVLVFEPPTHGASTHDQLSLDEIVAKIGETHAKVFPFHTKEEGLEKLSSLLQADDIVLLITSGGLGGIIPEVGPLTERLFPVENAKA